MAGLIIGSGTYIAVEGAIGVGKTTLAGIIAEELDARLILEAAMGNPFLPDFYRDPGRFGLQTQLSFLLSRHLQQSEIRQLSLFNRVVVTDYVFEKDKIFAYLNLGEREIELYNRVAELLAPDVPAPDMVIFLQSLPQRLLTNIRMRDFEFERSIAIEYLQSLCEAYSSFFFHWDRSPLLIVNATRIDFVNNEQHRRQLLEIIREMPAGTTYFNPET